MSAATLEVPLAPDYFKFHRGMDPELLTHGPLLIRRREASRWHRPRSGRRWSDGRVSFTYWCGQQPGWGESLSADALPEGEPACGTCEGRALGAGFPSSVLADAPVLYAPRITPPTICPSRNRFDGFADLPGNGRVGECLWCGSVERITGRARGYSWTQVRLARHAPLNLIDPCPNHGWLSMVFVFVGTGKGALVCECRTEEVSR